MRVPRAVRVQLQLDFKRRAGIARYTDVHAGASASGQDGRAGCVGRDRSRRIRLFGNGFALKPQAFDFALCPIPIILTLFIAACVFLFLLSLVLDGALGRYGHHVAAHGERTVGHVERALLCLSGRARFSDNPLVAAGGRDLVIPSRVEMVEVRFAPSPCRDRHA